MIDGYDAYCQYIAVKLTYDDSNSYDYFKYAGHVNQPKEVFQKRKDRRHFYVIAKRLDFDLDAVRNFFFVTMLYESRAWVGKLLESEAQDRYKNFVRYQNRFTYAFTEDLKQLKTLMDERGISINELVSIENGYKLLDLIFSEQVNAMLAHGLHRGLRFFDYWHTHIREMNPFMDTVILRHRVFQNVARIYSQGLTDQHFRSIIKETLIGGVL